MSSSAKRAGQLQTVGVGEAAGDRHAGGRLRDVDDEQLAVGRHAHRRGDERAPAITGRALLPGARWSEIQQRRLVALEHQRAGRRRDGRAAGAGEAGGAGEAAAAGQVPPLPPEPVLPPALPAVLPASLVAEPEPQPMSNRVAIAVRAWRSIRALPCGRRSREGHWTPARARPQALTGLKPTIFRRTPCVINRRSPRGLR